jgi:sortase A
MFPPIAVPFRRQVWPPVARNNLCVSTSPPPGEPGADTASSELLYALFPPAVAAVDGDAHPPSRPRRRWRVPSVPVLSALIAGVLLSGIVVAVDHTNPAEAVAAASTIDTPTTAPFEDLPIPPTTVTTLPAGAAAPAPRTRPIPPPANPTAPSLIVKIGEIRIPKIGLVHPVYEGVTLTVIDHGPGHWPGSAMPGQLGNAVFAGHRVTHTHPFRNLDKLVPGDEIQFVMPDGTYTYKMTAQQIVTPADTWIVNPTPDATLTLFACHPPGSATKRIVIRADYVGKS